MHDQCTVWWKKWDTSYVVVKAWTLEKGDISLYNLSYRKESLPTTMIRLAGWVTLIYLFNPIQNPHSSDSLNWESDVSVGVAIKKLFVNMTSTSQVDQKRTLSHSTLILGLNNWIFIGRSIFEQGDPPTEDTEIQIDVGDPTHSKLISISESLSPIEKQDCNIQVH